MATLRMDAENGPDARANGALAQELERGLRTLSALAPSLSADRVLADRVARLAQEVLAFSEDYGITINPERTAFPQ